MMFTNSDTIKWIGLSTFEVCIQLFCLLVCTILIVCKIDGAIDMSWYRVLSPMFAADGLTLYFSTIVFLRYLKKGQSKKAYRRSIWVALVLVLLLVFKILLCQVLESSSQTHTSYVMTPLFILWSLMMIRACKVK